MDRLSAADAPSGAAPVVAIVGGGASGVLLASQLLRQSPSPLDILIVEPGRLARGLAYGTPRSEHLLNVPSARMSALPDDPDHFVRWLEATRRDASPLGFVDRPSYGVYLEGVLAESLRLARPGVRLRRIVDRAAGIVEDGRQAAVRLAQGGTLAAAAVALAVGHQAGDGPVPSLRGQRGYVEDPWAPGALAAVRPDDPVLVIGTGLTMVDIVLELAARGHRAPLRAISRHGLVSRAHRLASLQEMPPAPPSPRGPALPGLRSWVRWLRARSSGAEASDWRNSVDALRPITGVLWRGLGAAERARFVRHVRPYWDAHRHRMAPSAAAAIDGLAGAGRLEVVAARVTGAHARPDGAIELQLRRRDGGPIALAARFVVNAAGPETDVARSRSPLLRQMIAEGLVRPDPLRLGLDAAPDGALVGASGRPSRVLYTLGPTLRGALWESIAIPEIREQARALAALWIESLPARREAPSAVA